MVIYIIINIESRITSNLGNVWESCNFHQAYNFANFATSNLNDLSYQI